MVSADETEVVYDQGNVPSFFSAPALSYTAMVVRSPCTNFGLSLGFLVLFMMGSSTVWENTDPGEYDWIVSTSPYSEDQDAIGSATDSVTKLEADEEGSRTTASFMHSMFLLYEWKDGRNENFVTAEHVQELCEIEARFATLEEYPDYCVLKEAGSTECADMDLSFPLQFYGLDHDWSCPLLEESVVEAKVTSMIESLDDEDGIGMLQYGFFFDKDAMDNEYALKVRSMMSLGAPLEGFESESDNINEQYKLYEGFYEGFEETTWKAFGKKSSLSGTAYSGEHVVGDIELRYWSFDIQQLEFKRTVETDMLFSMGSIIFVFTWIYIHVGSYFLAAIAMTQIVSSLPIGNFFYKVIGGIPYFDTLHTLVIFLVLGVGADDVFVLVDAWYQSESLDRRAGETDDQFRWRRMHVAYARTVHAVFNTSFTTAMAFVATAISPIMPISTFGIYAAICIILNYVMVCLITPGAIIVYDIKIKHWPCLCMPIFPCCTCCKAVPRVETEVAEKKVEEKTDGGVEKFFKNIYLPIITGASGKMNACIMIAMCVGWGAFAMNAGFKLTPPTEQEKWFPDKHMFTGLLDDNANMYLAGVDDQYVKMTWAFGIEGIDRDTNDNGKPFDIYVPNENRGTVVYDSDFDITAPATQQDILDTCELLRTTTCTVKACNFGKLSRDEGVTCFLEEFDLWLTETHSEARADITGAEVKARLLEFRADTKPASNPIAGSWEQTIGVIDGEIKFVKIESVSTMLTLQPVDDKKEVRVVVDAMIEDIDASSAATTGKLITEAGIEWTWMETEQGLVDGLFNGFAICFPVAFFVLLFATFNTIVSLFAIISIIFIVASVLGVVQMNGYDLGVAESIAGIIVIGFSVDYVVHLAHMYMEALEFDKTTRKDRVIYACENMGSTVVAGAVTTGGSGCFMFACQLVFFFKMALLIVMTIVFSFIYAFMFFVPLLVLAGPDTTMGNLKGGGFMGGDDAQFRERKKTVGGTVVTDEDL